MTDETLDSTINWLGKEQGSGGVQPKPLDGILLQRRTRRRIDLRTLDGALREHSKIYRALCDGTISAFAAEARSKVLGRHCKMISDRDTILQAGQLANTLEALREPGPPSALPHFGGGDPAGVSGDDYATQAAD